MESKYSFKFENLTVYDKAMEFGELVNNLTKKFPKEESNVLTTQFKQAADAIALNIAKGASGNDTQFYSYLGDAWHKTNECISCSSKARIRKYITFDEDEENRRMITELSKMITTLRNKIASRINDKN